MGSRSLPRALLPAVTLAAGLAVLLLPARAEPEPLPVSTPACSWRQELTRTLHELGEDPADWFRVRDEGYAGKAYLDSGLAAINPDLPCEYVADLVRHEWLHLQQGRLHGGNAAAYAAYGDRLEIVADCGAMLLGATYTPYRQRLLDEYGIACTARDLAEARRLIDYRGS